MCFSGDSQRGALVGQLLVAFSATTDIRGGV